MLFVGFKSICFTHHFSVTASTCLRCIKTRSIQSSELLRIETVAALLHNVNIDTKIIFCSFLCNFCGMTEKKKTEKIFYEVFFVQDI